MAYTFNPFTGKLDYHNGMSGSGSANQVAYWSSTSVITGDNYFAFNGTFVTIGNVTATQRVNIDGSLRFKSAAAASNKTFLYNNTGRLWTTVGSNTFLDGAGNTTATGIQNLALGGLTLGSLTSGTGNFGLGIQTLGNITEGSYNTAIGSLSAFTAANTMSARNTLIGANVQIFGGLGNDNIYIGESAYAENTGNGNTIIGTLDYFGIGSAGVYAANYNAGVGYRVLDSDVSYSCSLGALAGGSAGNNAIYLGYNVSGTTTDYELIIGNNTNKTITGNLSSKSVGIDIAPSSISARLHLPAGTGALGGNPLKFTSGAAGNPEDGAVNFTSSDLFLTRNVDPVTGDPIWSRFIMDKRNVRYLTTGLTILASDNYDIYIFNANPTATVSLYETTGDNKKITIKNIANTSLVVDGFSTETIDGQLTQTLNQWDSMDIVNYDAGAWVII